jgi:hypothetical protein
MALSDVKIEPPHLEMLGLIHVNYIVKEFKETFARDKQFAREFARRFQLKRTGMPIQTIEFVEWDQQLGIELELLVLERDGDNWIKVRFSGSSVPWFAFERQNPRRLLLDLLRNAIREAVLHEVDECIFYEGVRLFDPHERPNKLPGAR